MITRPPVQRTHSIFSDVGVMLMVAAVLYGIIRVAGHWQAPLQPEVEISLSLWALPGYTLLSLLRGLLAYGLSLVFSLIYGYVAAHNTRAERILIPLLDILQSIPVLGFLPGAVLALVALFPRTNTGLELASILMIFTSQVWNMTFSFYQSVRSIPLPLREAAALYRFNGWQRFRRMEFPAATVGLAWNSMMAMAGGWFFLIVCESFRLGGHDFRLPGLGAYMSVAMAHKDVRAIVAGIIAMVTMIVLVDTCLWRPVLVWAQRFRIEETASAEQQRSRVLDWLRASHLTEVILDKTVHRLSARLSVTNQVLENTILSNPEKRFLVWTVKACSFLGSCVTVALTVWGVGSLLRLLSHLSPHEWLQVCLDALWTFLRVMSAVVLGSLWTLPVGVWIGQSPRRRQFLQPLVQIAASFPAPMLYPLIVLVMSRIGLNLTVGAVVLMLLGTQWYILFNVIAGATAVPEDLRETVRSYQFSPLQRWFTLWWPAVFPYVITGWITAAGGAWNASIVAEYLTLGNTVLTAPGLGSLISVAAGHGRYALLAAGVLTMAIVVVLTNRYIWKTLYRLAEERYAY